MKVKGAYTIQTGIGDLFKSTQPIQNIYANRNTAATVIVLLLDDNQPVISRDDPEAL